MFFITHKVETDIQGAKPLRRGRLNAQHDAIESDTQTRHDHWAFDEAGNWAAWEVDADSQSFAQERDHNALNQITAITQQPPPPWPTPHYDADGRTIRTPQANNPEESYRYEYDAWGNVTKVFILNEYGHARTVSRYFYDARNYRIRAHIHPAESGPIAHFEDTYYDSQWRPLEKTRKGTGNTEPYKRYARYLWSPSPADYPDTLIRRDRNTIPSSSDLNETLYALQDGHASTIALVNATNGQVVERYAYEAFGSPLFLDDDFEEQSTSSCDWEILYTGYPLEPNTGNYHVRYRTYHPALGRWMTRDPLFIPGRLVRPKDPIGKVDGLNLYGFLGNNAAGLYDVLGLLLSGCSRRGCNATWSCTLTSQDWGDSTAFLAWRHCTYECSSLVSSSASGGCSSCSQGQSIPIVGPVEQTHRLVFHNACPPIRTVNAFLWL